MKHSISRLMVSSENCRARRASFAGRKRARLQVESLEHRVLLDGTFTGVAYEVDAITGTDYNGLPYIFSVESTGNLTTASGSLPIQYNEQFPPGYATMNGTVNFTFPQTVTPGQTASISASAQATWNNSGLGFGRPTSIDIGDGIGPDGLDDLGEFANGSTDAQVNWSDSVAVPTGPGSVTLPPVTVTVDGKEDKIVTLTASYQIPQAPAPTVTSVSPPAGSPSGGTTVTISGSGFTDASAVNFGDTSAGGFTVDSDTQITATSPAGTGTVDVTVTTPTGTSATSDDDWFTYEVVIPSFRTPDPLFFIDNNGQVELQHVSTEGIADLTPTVTTPGQAKALEVGEYLDPLTTGFTLPEVFIIGSDNQVYAQRFALNQPASLYLSIPTPTLSSPNSNYFLTAPGMFKEIRVANIPAPAGGQEVFALGFDNQVYALRIDDEGIPIGGFSLTTPGQVKTFEIGYEFNTFDPILFAIGMDNQVYEKRFDASGISAGGYTLTQPGKFTAITVGTDLNNVVNPLEVFAIGLDSQVYAQRFDTNGISRGNWFLTTPDTVKTLTVSTALLGPGQGPYFELFVTRPDDQLYVQHFDTSGISTGP